MDISTSVMLIAGLLLVNTIFLAVFLVKAFKAFSEAQKLFEAARLQLVPITHDVTRITTEVRGILTSVQKDLDKVGDSLDHVRDTTRNLKEFEYMIQERIQEPLLEITTLLSALIKGGRVFWQTLFRK
ncbi:MAG: DUF948 domain-containing protein [Deltaproteobacteria bacterium]|jgi:uncharacterized protein YoxC|nr:DUF948 domain-containing protein [Deltaproteobacteria bacterium]